MKSSAKEGLEANDAHLLSRCEDNGAPQFATGSGGLLANAANGDQLLASGHAKRVPSPSGSEHFSANAVREVVTLEKVL